jgi:hypothetical protein
MTSSLNKYVRAGRNDGKSTYKKSLGWQHSVVRQVVNFSKADCE